MTVSVYLAGSGDPAESVRVGYECRLINTSHNLTLAHDWAATIKKYGRNPKESKDQRRAWARGDLQAVADADVFWLLLPENPSVGAWVEFGAVLAFNMESSRSDQVTIIVSGDNDSIFAELATHRFRTDEAAFYWLETLAVERGR